LAEKMGAKIHNQKSAGVINNDKREKKSWTINDILTSKAATSIAKEAWNHLVRGIFGYLWVDIDGRRTFF
jgi:hypothetical protein